MWQKALFAFRSTWAGGAAQLCRPAASAFAAEPPFALRRVTRRLVLGIDSGPTPGGILRGRPTGEPCPLGAPYMYCRTATGTSSPPRARLLPTAGESSSGLSALHISHRAIAAWLRKLHVPHSHGSAQSEMQARQ